MNKATPAPESAEPLKFKNAALLNRLSDMAQAPYYATACRTLIQAEMAIVELERENAALRAEPAPAPVGEYPALPEPDGTCDVIVGHEMVGNMQADITATRDGYSADQMHAYLDADRAQRPAREVRLLTPQEIVAVLEGSDLWDIFQRTGWHSAPEMSFKRHGKSLAEELLRAACEVNGLTIKEALK